MLATEAQILRGEAITGHVTRALGLDKEPELRRQWFDQTNGTQTFQGWLNRRVQSGLEVTPSPAGSTIDIAYRSSNAASSAEMANALDRKSVESGKSVYVRVAMGGRRTFKKKKTK